MPSRRDNCSPSVISSARRADAEHDRVEAFIRDVYRRHYAADIRVDYPMQMSVCDNGAARPRHKIIEVDKLASEGCGGVIFLFIALASFLHQQQYAIVTVTLPLAA